MSKTIKIPFFARVDAAAVAAMAAMLTFVLWDTWSTRLDYAFGYLMPVFMAYVIWDRLPKIEKYFASAPGRDCGKAASALAGLLFGGMAVCVFLCAVAGSWFSVFGRSGGLFKVMQLGINFNDFMGYYMMSGDNGIGAIVVIVVGLIILLCGVSVAAFIMSVVSIIKDNGDYEKKFIGACGFGAVAAIIALLAAPLANAVIKSETGFDIKALSAEATPWVLLVLCVLAFVLKKFVFDKLAEKAES